MVITDITESRSRAEALGMLGLSYGIGMVIGPFVGGIITKQFELVLFLSFSKGIMTVQLNYLFVNHLYSEQHAAFVACIGSMVSIVLCVSYIPSATKKPESRSKEGKIH